jgi:geranylgeranyl pyrophosphate synthase
MTLRICGCCSYHLGLAFQIVDDILDVTAGAEVLGKPAMADMSLGLATAPLLYAAEEVRHPELKFMLKLRLNMMLRRWAACLG